MSNFHKAIGYLRKEKGLKQAEIAEIIGISSATWSDYERGKTQPNFDVLRKISEFFGVKSDDLITNEPIDAHLIRIYSEKEKQENAHLNAHLSAHLNQENVHLNVHPSVHLIGKKQSAEKVLRMPKVVTVDSAGNENITFVSMRARAGYLAGYGDMEFIQSLPTYRIPGLHNGTFRAFEVYGHSMLPTFHESDIIFGRFVSNFSEIRDNRVYIVVSKRDGVVLKRVVNRIQTDNKLILNSDNQRHPAEYPPIVIAPEEVLEIWYAVSYLSRQMREPGEIYNRLIDVESRLTLIEQDQRNISD